MTNYPTELVKAYRAGEIDRLQFCHAWAEQQGFDDTVKGYADKYGVCLTYRGRTAQIINGLLVWGEAHEVHTATTIKNMKNKIDGYERETKWI